MTAERTEETGESGLLTVLVGGTPVQLRALTYSESDEWLAKVGSSVASVDILEGDTPEQVTTSLLTRSSSETLRLVRAYDIEHSLPADLEQRISKRELKAALEMMVTVEDPFGEDAARSVATVFGEPSRIFAAGIRAASASESQLLESLLTGVSTSGASTSSATSARAGRRSSSSSAGRTATNGRRAKVASASR